MTYEKGRSYNADSIPSWFSRWREKRAKKISLIKLLSYEDQYLEDIGLSRREIIDELGYDPRELRNIRTMTTYPNPYLWNGNVITSNHNKQQR